MMIKMFMLMVLIDYVDYDGAVGIDIVKLILTLIS